MTQHWINAPLPLISNDDDTPQTYVVKAFKEGAEGVIEAHMAQSTVVTLVFQGPVRTGPTREYLIFEGGLKRIADPLKESRPYRDVDWSVYINMEEGWTEIKGQQRVPWQNDAPHLLFKRMVTVHPRPVDRFDAGDVQGKRMVSKGRFGGLISEIRKFVGNDVLPARYRSLSPEATIVFESLG